MDAGDQKAPLAAADVAKWKQAFADGTAGAMCDEIVRSRPIPMALANALVALIERDLEQAA